MGQKLTPSSFWWDASPGAESSMVRATRAAQPPEQWAYVRENLLSSLPNDFSGAEGNRSDQLELVSRNCNNAFLIRPIPIRERTCVNMNGDAAIRLAY